MAEEKTFPMTLEGKKKLEEELKRAYYKDEEDAEQKILERRRRQGLDPVPEDEEILPEDVE